MKTKLILLILALTVLFGCSDQEEAVDSLLLMSDNPTSSVDRPFKIRGYGDFTAVIPDGSCDLPVQIALDGGGNGTHLGLYSTNLTWCFAPPAGPLYIFGTITAANGDELNLETIGQGADPNGEVFETFIVTGGTGRFENASGEFNVYTTTVFDPNCDLCGTYTNYGEGTLSY